MLILVDKLLEIHIRISAPLIIRTMASIIPTQVSEADTEIE